MRNFNFSSLFLSFAYFSPLVFCFISEDCRDINLFLNNDVDFDCCSELVDDITCDADKFITGISIYDTDYDIPLNCTGFPYFSRMEYLTISCEMNSFPENILKMKTLKNLKISTNSKTDIPLALGDLDQLEHLSLTSSEIDNIPEGVFKLKNLKSLDLSSNSIQTIPLNITELSNLEYLDISDNSIKAIPPYIENLNKLEYIAFAENKLSELPEEFYNLSKLQNIVYSHNNFRNISSSIENFKNLKFLYANHNKLKDIPISLGNLKNLTTLIINNNKITTIPDELFNAKNLGIINISKNDVESIPSSINSIRLYDLDVSGNKLTTLPSELFIIPTLNKINIRGNKELKAKFFKVNGKKTIEECYIDDENIECMQNSACKYINFENSQYSNFTECSAEDVQTIVNMSTSDSISVKYSLKSMSIIISILIATLMYKN